MEEAPLANTVYNGKKIPTIFEFEINHNEILKELKSAKQYKYVRTTIFKQRNVELLVPHSQYNFKELVPQKDSYEFIQTHIAYSRYSKYNKYIKLYISANGLQFIKLRELFFILFQDILPLGDEKQEFLHDKTKESYFEKMDDVIKGLDKEGIEEISKMAYSHIIREGQLDIGEAPDVNVTLISEPLLFRHCPWTTSELVKPKKKSKHKQNLDIPTISKYLYIKEQAKEESASINSTNSNSSSKSSGRKRSKSIALQRFEAKMKKEEAKDVRVNLNAFIQNIEKSGDPYATNAKRIRSFINHIMRQLPQLELWANTSKEELDEDREQLERKITSDLYSKLFSATVDDHYRDVEVEKRLKLFAKLAPEHVDIDPRYVDHPDLPKAIKELKNMNDYKSPRDKMICVSNCCKILFNIIHTYAKEAASADTFFPFLLFTVAKANPLNFHSNLKYIEDFRTMLNNESEYFHRSTQGALEFWMHVTQDQLNMTKGEFEKFMGSQFFPDDPDETDFLHTDDPVDADLKLSTRIEEILPSDDNSSKYSNLSTSSTADTTVNPLELSGNDMSMNLDDASSSNNDDGSTSSTLENDEDSLEASFHHTKPSLDLATVALTPKSELSTDESSNEYRQNEPKLIRENGTKDHPEIQLDQDNGLHIEQLQLEQQEQQLVEDDHSKNNQSNDFNSFDLPVDLQTPIDILTQISAYPKEASQLRYGDIPSLLKDFHKLKDYLSYIAESTSFDSTNDNKHEND